MAHFRDARIGTKLMVLLGAMVLAFLSVAIAIFAMTAREQNIVSRTTLAMDAAAEKMIPLLEVMGEIRLDVVQVQQWLTDISATRGLPGYADGFDEAAGYAEKFAQDVATARGLAQDLGLGEILKTLDETESTFGPFYEGGKRMAQAYVEGGPAAGNPMMDEFDAVAGRMGEEIATLIVATRDLASSRFDSLQGEMHDIHAQGVWRRWLVVGGGLLTLLLAGIVLALVERLITRPLHAMTNSMQALAGGDVTREIPAFDRGDEIGTMGEALGRLRDASVEAMRAKVALGNVTSAVMIADDQGRIVTVNKAAEAMMRAGEADFRRDKPGFQANALVGSNFEAFHSRPEAQKGYLDTLTTTHRADFVMGGHSFTVTVNPVINPLGQRLGLVAEWQDRTQELAIEKEVATIIDHARAGDFSHSIALDGKQGFMRHLAAGINALVSTTQTALDDIGALMTALAKGDLSQRITGDYSGSFGRLQQDGNGMAEQLARIVGQVVNVSTQVAEAAQEIAAGNQNLSERTENQAASLEETAASIQELTDTVETNITQAEAAAKHAAQTQKLAETGSTVVENAIDAMKGIEGASGHMVEILGVIDEIAFQTNLLALNAAVEAARAGETGKGFAVVAGEVRTLAQRSAQAAKDIRGLIEDSNKRIQGGVKLVSRTGDNLGTIASAIDDMAEIIRRIAQAGREQGDGIQQVNTAISQMDEMTQRNAALVEQSTAATATLADQSKSLQDLMGFFRGEGSYSY